MPADKKLYALRDVTATVDNVSLIAASIMSKKIAAGADAIVLDVKVGDGAFMKTLDDARVLAETMLALGQRAGREVVCLLTDMDQPLGARGRQRARGARGASTTVRGEGPPDFTELVLDACAHLLALSDLGIDERRRPAPRRGGRRRRLGATPTYERWIARAGRRPRRGALPTAPVVREVVAPRGGLRRARSARSRSASPRSTSAPAGATKDDAIDHAVGVVCLTKRGDAVAARRAARRDPRARRARRPSAAAATCSPRTSSATSRRAQRPIVLEVDRLTSRACGDRLAWRVPELPEVETVRARLAPVLEGRRFEHVEILDPRLDAAVRPGRGRGRARRRARRRASSAAASI